MAKNHASNAAKPAEQTDLSQEELERNAENDRKDCIVDLVKAIQHHKKEMEQLERQLRQII
jgi:nitrate/TMAO reductase-like tetraheme cytochrome c subunit